ncbi:Gfo/Idh/MocA family protein [Dapis sp. BLCC M126]|uniref:Gfo/Idh/MocA family protein n=1 Tax=Dapis sp. BLCC M126 TaxID=3400189 RepID=UPI003CF84550
MNNQTIGVAVIGTGFGQKVHIPGLQEHHKTEVLAVYNPDLEKAKSIASNHNIPHACNTIDEIISIHEVSAVTISTPPFLHYEMAKQVLGAGKHLLLEKPTTLKAEEAQELYHIAATNKCVATMDFEFRYIPAWQLFAEILADGYVGDKRLIKIDWLASSRANPSRPWNWYSQKDKGGGALGAIASHTFDYINWFFGPAKKLWGQLNTSIKTRPDPTVGDQLKRVDADDTCNIMLELADGTPCQICISSVTYQGRGHWVEVYGSKGTLIVGSNNQKDYVHGFKVWGSQNGENLAEINIPERLDFPKVYSDGRIAPFIRVVDNWVQAIEAGKSVVPSLREGVYSQLLMDLTHESNLTATWVNVPDLDEFIENKSSF